MASSDLNSFARQSVSLTASRFCQVVQDEQLNVSDEVEIYIEQNRVQDITAAMESSLNTNFCSYLRHAGNLTCLPLAALQDELLLPNHGVYAAVVRNTNGECSLYIGSSYGRKGLGNRVLKNHLNPIYRKRHPDKALYIAMAETEVITSFICLLSYAEPVPIGQVLLAEAVRACLFNTFDSDLYRDIRLQCLPRVDMTHGLNRSDPLRTLPVGPKSIGNDVTTFRRLRTLHNCLGKGPIRVSYHVRRERETKSSWRFQLFTAMFTIPKKIAATWNLANNPEINVEWQVSSGVHPHAFAAEAGKQEDGRCVGIRAFKIVRGKIEQHWIRRCGKDAVRVANTLHDFLKGHIVGQDYTWKASRKYIFSEEGGSKMDSPQNALKRRGRVGLPYDGKDFQWDDGKRLPETKPRSGTRASIRTRMEIEECTLSYEDWVAEMHQKYLAPYHAELSKAGHRTYHRNWAERAQHE